VGSRRALADCCLRPLVCLSTRPAASCRFRDRPPVQGPAFSFLSSADMMHIDIKLDTVEGPVSSILLFANESVRDQNVGLLLEGC
jgi:hypothetical protein